MAKNKKKNNKEKKSKKSKKSVESTFKGDVMNAINEVKTVYDSKLEETFGQFDLSHEQYRILKILNEAPSGGYSLREIRESLPNQTSNATRLVDKLHGKKFLSKKSSAADKRQLKISLTQQGVSVLSETTSRISNMKNKVATSLSGKEGKVLQKNLEKLSLTLNDL